MALGLVPAARAAVAEVVTRLPGETPRVAVTLDACETPGAYLDRSILDFLLAERAPFAIFASGRVVERFSEDFAELAKTGLVAVENHSQTHPRDLREVSEAVLRREIEAADRAIVAATGRRPAFFRYPGGHRDARTDKVVAETGHRVVHWTFPSGDPDPNLAPETLSRWVLAKTRPGSILIFHVNGRGKATGRALPAIVAGLRARGYAFVSLEEALGQDRPEGPASAAAGPDASSPARP